MFGYVTVCEPELKVKEFKKYKAYYCGLCKSLKDRYGSAGQMTLTYDMTFAVILLSSLYECENKTSMHRCKIHPVKKQIMIQNEFSEYAADMNVILAYYHLRDDWMDEKKFMAFVGSGILSRRAKRVMKQYPRQCDAIERELKALAECEKRGSTDMDEPAGCFGRLMEELFVYKQDIWERYLRKLGFFMGKFIYIMDAWDDLEKDLEKGNYNPLREYYEREDYESFCKNILEMMIAESSAAFEKLPCLQDVEILRNILYMGVWQKYQKRRNEKNGLLKEAQNKETSI